MKPSVSLATLVLTTVLLSGCTQQAQQTSQTQISSNISNTKMPSDVIPTDSSTTTPKPTEANEPSIGLTPSKILDVVEAGTTTATESSAPAVAPKEDSLIDENGKINVKSMYLDDAIDFVVECGVNKSLIRYESDNGDKIRMKNNWEVIDQRVEDRKLILTCTKVRSAPGEAIKDSLKKAGKFILDDETMNKIIAIGDAAGNVDELLDHFDTDD